MTKPTVPIQIVEQPEVTKGDYTVSREFACTLSPEEILFYSKLMAKNHQDRTKAESTKGEVMAEFNARIKKLDAEIGVISQKISNGYEYRDVQCRWYYHWKDGYKALVREDTGDEAERKDIDPNERQTELPLDKSEEKLPENPEETKDA